MAYYECECDNFDMTEGQDSFKMNEGIPGPGVPAGGSAGQVLRKTTSADYDTEWDTLTAGDVAFNKESGYLSGTVGRYLQLLDSEDVQYTYGGVKELGTVGETLDYLADKSVEIGEDVDDVKNTLNHKADVIYDTVSGDIANFPDGADGLPVKDLTVGIEPVQDLHGYANPWPAGGGKNLLSGLAQGGINGSGATVSGQNRVRSDNFIACSAESNYTINAIPAISGATVNCAIYYYQFDDTFISSAGWDNVPKTYITPANCAKFKIALRYADNSDVTPSSFKNCQVESGSSATTYAPYSNICPISGWTGCNVSRTGKNLYSGGDVTVGTGAGTAFWTFDRKPNTTYTAGFVSPVAFPLGIRDGGSTQAVAGQNVITFALGSSVAGTFLFYVNGALSEQITLTECFVTEGTISPSDYVYEPFGTTIPISWQSAAGTVYGGTLDVTSGVLTVTDANIASYNGETLPGEWISDRDVYAAGTTPTTGAQVVYKLATPQTYQLTPTEVTTLLGQNNIWADCGDSTVEYPCDTKLYIQKINTPTDDDMIADANIASGQYFIVNNNLYLSTAAILAGDPIKPGTNCTLTNLAAALNAINS